MIDIIGSNVVEKSWFRFHEFWSIVLGIIKMPTHIKYNESNSTAKTNDIERFETQNIAIDQNNEFENSSYNINYNYDDNNIDHDICLDRIY